MSQQIDMDAVIDELRKGWIKGQIESAEGVCLIGACDRIRYSVHAKDLIRPVITEQFPHRIGWDEDLDAIANFNDHDDTTLDDVILVCEKARAAQGEIR